ncbi:MAG TPA: helix-turn-helix domain-containing protein [Burkholderiaceae bacterium]|nr:helix-turn-helix domain-containing protein [Burkholderiaceae bacterium]
MSEILSTDALPAAERLPFWIDMICQTYVQLECDAPRHEDFRGSIVSHRLPGLDLSVVSSRAQRVLRTPRAIRRATDDYIIVSLQTRGNAVISQDGRDAVMVPGDFAIYDSTRPYTLRFDDDFEEIVLKLHGDRLRAMLRDSEKLTATTVSGRAGAGHLLINMIGTLRDEVDSLAPASAAAVASGVVNVLVAGLQSLPACGRTELSSMAAYHVARIRACIDERLHDPALTIEAIAAEVGLSVGHLHRLFRSEALSPSQYLWSRRLEGCSRELLDPRRARASVAEIAFGWGFNDAAHFSRAFRERFHCAPREWRRQGAVNA